MCAPTLGVIDIGAFVVCHPIVFERERAIAVAVPLACAQSLGVASITSRRREAVGR